MGISCKLAGEILLGAIEIFWNWITVRVAQPGLKLQKKESSNCTFKVGKFTVYNLKSYLKMHVKNLKRINKIQNYVFREDYDLPQIQNFLHVILIYFSNLKYDTKWNAFGQKNTEEKHKCPAFVPILFPPFQVDSFFLCSL